MMRITIHGSCVSRDTFEFLPDGTELVRYIARQSLISVGSAAPPVIDVAAHLTSPFQIRMLTGDLAGDACTQLQEVADETDLLLVDLTDERLGVFHLHDGTFITRTVEGLFHDMYPPGLQLLELGTDEHFSWFSRALDRWATVIEDAGLREKMVLLHVPWAGRTVTGAPTPPSFHLSADIANVTYSRYVYALSDRLDPWIIRPRVPVVAHGDHQWGPAPFHYVPAVHQDLADQLVELGEQLVG